MRNRVLATLGLSATLLLAGCGSSSITVTTGTSASQQASGVVTSDGDAIAALKTKLAAFFGTGASVADGDQHTGNQVCTFNASKNGHSYMVVLYGTLPATSCDSQAQAAFLAQAP